MDTQYLQSIDETLTDLWNDYKEMESVQHSIDARLNFIDIKTQQQNTYILLIIIIISTFYFAEYIYKLLGGKK